MAKRGRPRKPNEMKILEGRDYKEKVPAPMFSEAPLGKVPQPPKNLGAIAKAEWRRIAPELHAVGLLRKLDLTAFATYCETYQRWIEASQAVRDSGMVVRSPNGYPILNPYHSIAQGCAKDMLRFLTEFGMTPSSRSRIQADQQRRKPPEDEAGGASWESLLNEN